MLQKKLSQIIPFLLNFIYWIFIEEYHDIP